MKSVHYKHVLFIIATLITGMAMAQSANRSTIPFKEIHQKQFTDNFTGREIKKKELDIAPSKIVLLNTVANNPSKEDKTRKEKKINL
jgi:hypothetical protein